MLFHLFPPPPQPPLNTTWLLPLASQSQLRFSPLTSHAHPCSTCGVKNCSLVGRILGDDLCCHCSPLADPVLSRVALSSSSCCAGAATFPLDTFRRVAIWGCCPVLGCGAWPHPGDNSSVATRSLCCKDCLLRRNLSQRHPLVASVLRRGNGLVRFLPDSTPQGRRLQLCTF